LPTGRRAVNRSRLGETIHTATDTQLKGVIVQASGLDASSSTVGAIAGSFKALKAYANFDAEPAPVAEAAAGEEEEETGLGLGDEGKPVSGLRLGYTINLNLPPTSDIAVFDAIFRSLRQHLLR